METQHSWKDAVACCYVVLSFLRDVTSPFRSIPAAFIALTVPQFQYRPQTLVQQWNLCVFRFLCIS